MSRSDRFCICCTKSLSHACGSESINVMQTYQLILFIPCEWEWVGTNEEAFELTEGYPTRVGMSRDGIFSSAICSSLSHAGGNESTRIFISRVRIRFIPREWEWSGCYVRLMNNVSVYSTHVGVSRFYYWNYGESWRLSHASGNESNHALVAMFLDTVVPHTWEWVGVKAYGKKSHVSGNESFLPDQSIIPSFRTWQLEM